MVDLSIENETTVTLESIQSKSRKQGFASLTLQQLCTLADQFGVTIVLEIQPFGKRGLSATKLKDWYIRFGFRVDKETAQFPLYQRKPIPRA